MAISTADEDAFREVKRSFPLLSYGGSQLTSAVDPRYNCIAWAAGEKTRFWWPNGPYWPGGIPKDSSVSSFIQAYQRLNYTECDSREPEQGVEKIALYVNSSYKVTHAARQLPSGLWTSKLGKSVDISHELISLEGSVYGKVATILKRSVQAR